MFVCLQSYTDIMTINILDPIQDPGQWQVNLVEATAAKVAATLAWLCWGQGQQRGGQEQNAVSPSPSHRQLVDSCGVLTAI